MTRQPIAADYTMVATARGQRVLWFRMFGSYQGEWLLMSADDERYWLYKDWYGSCSGCDAIEATDFPSPLYADDPKAQEFIADYPPFLEMRPDAALRIAKREGNLLAVMPRNQRIRERDFDVSHVGRQLALVVKAQHGELEPLEVLELDNQEARREAIEAFGVEEWADEVEAEEIDREGDNRLMRLPALEGDDEPFVFLVLKDSSTPRRYIMRVRPSSTSVRAARASTFDVPADRFVLAQET